MLMPMIMLMGPIGSLHITGSLGDRWRLHVRGLCGKVKVVTLIGGLPALAVRAREHQIARCQPLAALGEEPHAFCGQRDVPQLAGFALANESRRRRGVEIFKAQPGELTVSG
jgi:hypothetical protein